MEYLLILPLIMVATFFLFRGKKPGTQKISTDSLPDAFIVFDLETTGLDPTRHEIIEIAAIRYKKGVTTHETFQALVKPTRKVPKKITEITGITQAMVDTDGESLNDVIRQFIEFIGDHRLVTFNAEFDMAFLQAALAELGFAKLNNQVSCVLKMARRAWPNRKSYRLRDLASDGQFASGDGHRALEDARCALIVYAATVSQLNAVS